MTETPIDIYTIDSNESDVNNPDKNTAPDSKEKVKLTGTERLDELERQLQVQRDSWGVTIKGLVKQIRNVNDLIEAQVDMLSQRQVLIDILIKFRIRVSKISSLYDKEYKRVYQTYFNHDYILNQKEKDAMTVGDLNLYTRQIGLLESQVNFFQESIKTIDQMAWAIKNRLKVEEI